MDLTNEQKEIINFVKKNNNNNILLKIEALAGTGKTTTLLEIVKNLPNKKFLIIVFNKLAKEDLNYKIKQFNLTNVKSYNIDSLAYQILKQENFNLSVNNYKTFKDILTNELNIYNNHYKILQEFNKWCISNKPLKSLKTNSNIYNHLILKIFLHFKNKKIGNFEFFVKLLSLEYTELFNHYDCIMLDEAQDTNQVTFDFFKKINCNFKIVVGDRQQSIYRFRGAHNFMEDLKSDKTLYLTNSFRFGYNIEYLTNPILKLLNSKVLIKGKGNKKNNNKKIIITRTNSSVIENLIENEYYKFVNYNLKNRLQLLVNEFKQLVDYNNKSFLENLNLLLEIDIIFNDYEMVIKKLNDSIEELENIEELNYDYVLFIKLANKFTFKEIERIIKKTEVANNNDNLLIGTAHTTKGLEFNTVQISSDFLETIENYFNYYEKNKRDFSSQDKLDLKLKIIDELRLLYVAITRTITNINIGKNYVKEYLTYSYKLLNI